MLHGRAAVGCSPHSTDGPGTDGPGTVSGLSKEASSWELIETIVSFHDPSEVRLEGL